MQKALVSMKKTSYLQSHSEDTNLENFATQTFQSPGDKYIGDILRHFYRAMRPRLVKEMEESHCLVEAISLDHTFKVTSRIFSTVDQQKKQQFDALLIVMNPEGIILGFSLVRSQSLQDKLSKRLLQHINRHGTVKIACVDNCCLVRKQLHSILEGLDRVVLDVFHGLQRIAAKEKSCSFSAGRKEMFNRQVGGGNKKEVLSNVEQIMITIFLIFSCLM